MHLCIQDGSRAALWINCSHFELKHRIALIIAMCDICVLLCIHPHLCIDCPIAASSPWWHALLPCRVIWYMHVLGVPAALVTFSTTSSGGNLISLLLLAFYRQLCVFFAIEPKCQWMEHPVNVLYSALCPIENYANINATNSRTIRATANVQRGDAWNRAVCSVWDLDTDYFVWKSETNNSVWVWLKAIYVQLRHLIIT